MCGCEKCERQQEKKSVEKYLYTADEYCAMVPDQPYIVNKSFKNTASKKFSVVDKQRTTIKRLHKNKSKVGHADIVNAEQKVRQRESSV